MAGRRQAMEATEVAGGARALALRRPGAGRGMNALRRRPRLLAGLALGALGIAALVSVAAGTVAIAPADTLGIVLRALGIPVGVTWSPAAETIVLDLRLPRVLTAIVVGAGLGVAGATFQGLLRNPLADPYVLGTASGAALGAAIAVLVPVRAVILEFGLVNALAFVGALGAVAVVWFLGRGGTFAPLTGLLLTGYAVGSLLAAGLAMTMYLSGANLRQIVGFLLGGLEGSSWLRLAVAAPLVIGGSAAILARARTLDGLLLGEEAAAHLGVDVRRERAILLGLASLVTAAAVAVSGLIGFIGLVAPHVVRLLVGPSARLVVPLSAVFGAVLLVLADLGARLAGEIPVGVVTALIGAPFFVVLLRRARLGYEL
jgi:iron complex transport system permease protein